MARGVDLSPPVPAVPATARARARAEITAEILAAARRRLRTDGAAGLSLRAVARDLGMVSSAVYRYVASRDELLTRLIVAAYDSLGAAAEAAESPVPRRQYRARFAAVCRAVRTWAQANPHEYALIFGSPVPGYVAPADTIGPASRVPLLLVALLRERPAADTRPPARLSGRARAAVAPVREALGPGVPEAVLQRGLLVWAGIFGVISFELFGHFHDVVRDEPGDRDAFFDACIDRWALELGIA